MGTGVVLHDSRTHKRMPALLRTTALLWLPLVHLNEARKQYERSHLLLWLLKTIHRTPPPRDKHTRDNPEEAVVCLVNMCVYVKQEPTAGAEKVRMRISHPTVEGQGGIKCRLPQRIAQLLSHDLNGTNKNPTRHVISILKEIAQHSSIYVHLILGVFEIDTTVISV